MEIKNKAARKIKSNFRKGISLKRLIISSSLSFVLLISLFFSSFFNFALKLFPNLEFLNNANFEIHFVSVGQGDSTLIRLPDGKTMIIDFAPESSYPRLKEYIENIFFKKGEDKIFDYAILTHSDSDHRGGLNRILAEYKINSFYYSLDLENSSSILGGIENKVINSAGNTITGENYLITWLSPNREYYEETNDYSPIILFEFESYSFIVSGDATSEVGEIEAMNYFIENKDIDLLKLGHHGSKTSTSLEFLECFTPEIAVVSHGTTYGHPASETIENLAKYDDIYDKNLSNYLSTNEKGNIIITNKDIEFVSNVYDYIFVPYYLIIIPIVLFLMVNALIPRRIHRDEWLKMRARKLKKFKVKK